MWRDEFESPGLEDCLDKTWPMAFVYVNDGKSKYLVGVMGGLVGGS